MKSRQIVLILVFSMGVNAYADTETEFINNIPSYAIIKSSLSRIAAPESKKDKVKKIAYSAFASEIMKLDTQNIDYYSNLHRSQFGKKLLRTSLEAHKQASQDFENIFHEWYFKKQDL